MYDSTPRRWYGMPIEAQVRLDLFARGWSCGSTPFFLSLMLFFYLLYPHLMLTLGSSSNKWAITTMVEMATTNQATKKEGKRGEEVLSFRCRDDAHAYATRVGPQRSWIRESRGWGNWGGTETYSSTSGLTTRVHKKRWHVKTRMVDERCRGGRLTQKHKCSNTFVKKERWMSKPESTPSHKTTERTTRRLTHRARMFEPNDWILVMCTQIVFA